MGNMSHLVNRCEDTPRTDLVASAARLASARGFAEYQSRIVDHADGEASRLNIDLLFLAEESVLVFEDTHRLLTRIANGNATTRRQDPFDTSTSTHSIAVSRGVTPGSSKRVALALAMQVLVLALVSAAVLEIVDPAPMNVFASSAPPLEGP